VTDKAMRRALARTRDGKALDEAEALVLLGARGADLDPLFEASTRVRDAAMVAAGRPGVVTYSRKVFIPLTRLCRDRCHYCTFVTVPHHLPAAYLSPDEVLDIARAGAAQGCKEALFTLGDRPEDRWPEAREWLDAHGYDDTLAYVRAMAIRVLEETGLLPHLNPGVLSWSDLQRLKPVAPSMGMMLETMSRRLFEKPGQAHFGSPDKDPAVRLRVLEDAGRVGVPFTTGILVGIGETVQERLDSILAIRRVAREYGSIQECIVQNFRAKDDTAMRSAPDLVEEEYLATIAVTRLLLGPSVSVQAPPNLSEPQQISGLLAAGAGLTYEQIAAQLGYENRGTVFHMVSDALKAQTVEAVDQLRSLEVERLDKLQHAVWQRAMEGDVPSVHEAARCIMARCRLLGLDGPSVFGIEAAKARTVVVQTVA